MSVAVPERRSVPVNLADEVSDLVLTVGLQASCDRGYILAAGQRPILGQIRLVGFFSPVEELAPPVTCIQLHDDLAALVALEAEAAVLGDLEVAELPGAVAGLDVLLLRVAGAGLVQRCALENREASIRVGAVRSVVVREYVQITRHHSEEAATLMPLVEGAFLDYLADLLLLGLDKLRSQVIDLLDHHLVFLTPDCIEAGILPHALPRMTVDQNHTHYGRVCFCRPHGLAEPLNLLGAIILERVFVRPQVKHNEQDEPAVQRHPEAVVFTVVVVLTTFKEHRVR